MNNKDIIAELTEKLDKADAESFKRLESYAKGNQPLVFLPDEVKRQVGTRLKSLNINWASLVLRARLERTRIEDFRLANQESFEPAWDIWQRNNMDQQSPMAHQDAYLFGRGFISVWGSNGRAVMRAESPRQVWVEHDPGSGEVRYAIKRWFDRDRGYLNVLTPDRITKYRTSGKRDEGMDITNLPPDSWEGIGSVRNTFGRVPYFPLIHRRSTLNPLGESCLNDVLPLCDAINKLATDMMVSAEYHAMPRRWATGVEVVEDEEGETSEAFTYKKGRTWIAEDPQARLGTLPEADLSNFISSIEMLQMHLAALAALPPHYFDAAKGSLASADSIRASEASLVSEIRETTQGSFSEGHEDAMRFALEIEGYPITPDLEKMEARWKDPENQTLAQIVDSAIKRASVGVPQLQLWEDMGYSKAQIERMKKMAKEEADERARQAADLGRRPEGQGVPGVEAGRGEG